MRENKNINDKKTIISSMFINTIAQIIIDISTNSNLDIVLSGGVFQNKTLLNMVVNKLKSIDKKVYFQRDTPINDGGISIGQAWWAVKNNLL